jgi:hypothetical protein
VSGVSTCEGIVTSLEKEHENSAPGIFSNDRDCLAPMRRAMERTVEVAQEKLASFFDTIPPNECANYFNGAGYTAT